jgi:hypothetical protein
MSGRDPRVRNQEVDQAQLRGFARSFSEIEWLLLILVVLASWPGIATWLPGVLYR